MLLFPTPPLQPQKALPIPIIGFGKTGADAVAFLSQNNLPDTDLFIGDAETGTNQNNLAPYLPDHQPPYPKAAYLVAHAGEPAWAESLQNQATALKAKGIFTILLCLGSGTNPSQEMAELRPSLRFADSIILLADAAEPADTFALMGQLIDSLNQIMLPGIMAEVNVDFEDIKTVIAGKIATGGVAITHGPNRAMHAARQVLAPLLMPLPIVENARQILLSIQSGSEQGLEMEELTDITEYIQEKAGNDADIIFGHGENHALENKLKIILLISGP